MASSECRPANGFRRLWPVFLALSILAWGSARAEEKDCLDCHGKKKIVQEAGEKRAGLYISQKDFEASVHEVVDCVECHPDAEEGGPAASAIEPTDPGQPSTAARDGKAHGGPVRSLPCRSCHEEIEPLYLRSTHARRTAAGDRRAAGCQDCHGDVHRIASAEEPQSTVYRTNIPETCGACHGERFVVEEFGLRTRPFFSYQESVHGKAVKEGSLEAAVCTDCHNSHDIDLPSSPRSPIFRFNIPRTCGRCHAGAQQEYERSIHGKAIGRGISQSPVCSDCHGVHLIKPHIDPTSSVAVQAISRTTCPQCHEGVRLAEEFGVPGGRVSSYMDSYHGLAGRWGAKTVANCASCHGVHLILPSSDSASSIHPDRLLRTCGRCHPGASANFARGKVHVVPGTAEDFGGRMVAWVAWVYLPLIGLTLGTMLLHNVLAFRKKLSLRTARRGPTTPRLSLHQRAQHLVLMVSFFALALSGFALKFPDSWFAWMFGSSEEVRRVFHRIASLALTSLSFYHLAYLSLTHEGRDTLKGLLFRKRDLVDLRQKLRYDLGKTGERPRFERCGYVEKSEYWAAAWGTVIMMATGFVLWFETEAMVLLPRWGIDVAGAIHYYEALLATLAVVVWHFYHVMFDPDVYPMNWAWWDGQAPPEPNGWDSEPADPDGREQVSFLPSKQGEGSEPPRAAGTE